PAAFSRWTTLWSNGARKSPVNSAPSVSRLPAMPRLFLIAIGTPAKGRGSPGAIASASASASSPKTSTNAFSFGLSSPMRSSEVAEPDKAGGALRYRGVDIEDLVGTVPFEQVWGLLVDGTLMPGLPPAEPWPLTVRSGDPRVDVQSCLAMLGPEWGMHALIDI